MTSNCVRKVLTTEPFKAACNSNNISSEILEFIESWAQTTPREQVPRNKIFYTSPSRKFEIWMAGIPNPAANKGKSGGFRLVYFYVFNESLEELYLDFIEDRKEIGFKKDHPKKKEKFEKYLRNLKKDLLESLES